MIKTHETVAVEIYAHTDNSLNEKNKMININNKEHLMDKSSSVPFER